MNLLAVVIAAVASFMFGWLWYGVLFSEAWEGGVEIALGAAAGRLGGGGRLADRRVARHHEDGDAGDHGGHAEEASQVHGLAQDEPTEGGGEKGRQGLEDDGDPRSYEHIGSEEEIVGDHEADETGDAEVKPGG